MSLGMIRKRTTPNNNKLEIFEDFYNRYWEQVYTICFRSTRDRELSEDMTQDIFHSVWERREKLYFTTDFEHYLSKAAKAKVTEHFRNNAIRARHLSEITFLKDATVSDSDSKATESYLLKELKRISDTFPEIRRKIFKMSREKGMSNTQISITLNVSERNVRYHLQLAVSQLRKGMKNIGIIILLSALFLLK